jgi:hypothetical protein
MAYRASRQRKRQQNGAGSGPVWCQKVVSALIYVFAARPDEPGYDTRLFTQDHSGESDVPSWKDVL